VAAGLVLSAAAAYADPHLRARGFFETVSHPEAGSHEYPGMLWKMSHTPASIRRPPAALIFTHIFGSSAILGSEEEQNLRSPNQVRKE
jgi:crotonobetainyl-CoA:carnitine CoA-transferase CaiB-like acyl-CoA transferase